MYGFLSPCFQGAQINADTAALPVYAAVLEAVQHPLETSHECAIVHT